jgi:hypothetical protein
MVHRKQPRPEQIQEEIAQLERELEARRTGERPAPASVVHAYHLLLARHYEQLAERLADPRAQGITAPPEGTDERRDACDERTDRS